MDAFIQTVISGAVGAGVAYGVIRADVNHIKEQLKEKAAHGERLAAIEAKIDLLIKNKD